MKDHYSFDVEDDIQVGENHIDIVNRIQSSKKSEVYQVSIGDIGHDNYGLLKVIKDNNNELKNTISFHANDTSNYMVEMISKGKDKDKKFLLLKFYDKGSITKYIKKNTLSDEEKDTLIHNVLKIGCHLHKDNYIHADIKPDNFFIDDENKVRLGDLEFLQQLEDIHHDPINKVCGTKGFKYSQGASYDMQDEIFAYIATIYFIESGEVLLSITELNQLDTEDNIVESINTFSSQKIDSLTHVPLKNFLLSCLADISNEESIDCCELLERYEDIPPRNKPESPGRIEEDTLKEKMVKIWNTHKKPISISVALVFIVLGVALFYPSASSDTDSTTPVVSSTIIKPTPVAINEDLQEQVADETSDREESVIITHNTHEESIVSTENNSIPKQEEKPEAIPYKPNPAVEDIEEDVITETTTSPEPVTLIEPIVQQEEKITPLITRIASLQIKFPADKEFLHVDIPSEVELGDILNIKLTPRNAEGYLQILLIDSNDVQTLAFENPEFLDNNKTSTIPIKTQKPSGLHYILVIFTAIKYDFTLDNYHEKIKKLSTQSGGMEYVNIYPVNIYE